MIWKILEKNARPRKRENTENYALTGKLFCGKCKTPMIGTSGTSKAGARYYYYRCKKCRRNVRKDIIEANVADGRDRRTCPTRQRARRSRIWLPRSSKIPARSSIGDHQVGTARYRVVL